MHKAQLVHPFFDLRKAVSDVIPDILLRENRCCLRQDTFDGRSKFLRADAVCNGREGVVKVIDRHTLWSGDLKDTRKFFLRARPSLVGEDEQIGISRVVRVRDKIGGTEDERICLSVGDLKREHVVAADSEFSCVV